MESDNEVKFKDEMEKMEYEPLLPIEKKLIIWSLSLGTVLLVTLYWVSAAFFRRRTAVEIRRKLNEHEQGGRKRTPAALACLCQSRRVSSESQA